MASKVIDMNRLRDAIPKRAILILTKKDADKKRVPVLECKVNFPFLDDEEFEMVKQWQRDIIGNDNIIDIFIEEAGQHWNVYMRAGVQFINMSDSDRDTYYTN